MQRDFAIYKSLLTVLARNTLRSGGRKRGADNKKRGNVSAKATMLIGGGAFGIYAAFMSVMITSTAVSQGMQREILYTLLAMSQMIVLFFGAVAVMGYVYFSKDNDLLSALPVKPQIVFAARFSMAYLSELAFSLVISVPMLISYGVVCLSMNAGIQWHFFVVMLVAVPLLPMIPLFLITLLSMPLMYLVSFFKRRSVGNSIALGLLYVVMMGLYFTFVFGSQTLVRTVGDIAEISSAGMLLFTGVKSGTIFNYNLVEALSGSNTFLNIVLYIVGNLLLFGIVVFMSSFFYKRAIARLGESGGGSSGKKKKGGAAVSISVRTPVYKSFFMKEIRTLFNTPMLLVSTIMGLLLPPVLLIFISSTMRGSMMGEDMSMDSGLFMTGFALYIGFLLVSSTNMVSTIGISREGKQLYILKTLPLPIRIIIKCKLMFASILTGVSTVVLSVCYPLILGVTNPVAVIMFPIVIFSSCMGVNCLALHSDLKKPKLDWTNVSELTRNNKNTLRFMLPVLLIGFAYLIIGIVLGIQTAISPFWSYVIFFGFALVPSALLLGISWTRLFKNPEALFDRIGE